MEDQGSSAQGFGRPLGRGAGCGLVEIGCELVDLIEGAAVVERRRFGGQRDAIEVEGGELGVLKGELTGVAVRVGIPGGRQVEGVSVVGDGVAVAQVPEGGVNAGDGVKADQQDQNDGEAAADGEEEKNEAAEVGGDLLQEIFRFSLARWVGRTFRLYRRARFRRPVGCCIQGAGGCYAVQESGGGAGDVCGDL